VHLFGFIVRIFAMSLPPWRAWFETWAYLSKVSSAETLLSRLLLFQLLFGSFRLGFNSPTLLVPGAGARISFFSRLFAR